MKKNLIITAIIGLFFCTANAQVKTIARKFSKEDSTKTPNRLPKPNLGLLSVWGEKPYGHRIEIRIANNVFMQDDKTFRESHVMVGKTVFVYGYHAPKPGELSGYWDVKEPDIDEGRDMGQAGRNVSIITEGDYTVYRIAQHGMNGYRLGYYIDANYLAGNSAFKKGLVITGNTVLNGTVANPTTFDGEPVVITISKSNLR
jgi:hypothetical protein